MYDLGTSTSWTIVILKGMHDGRPRTTRAGAWCVVRYAQIANTDCIIIALFWGQVTIARTDSPARDTKQYHYFTRHKHYKMQSTKSTGLEIEQSLWNSRDRLIVERRTAALRTMWSRVTSLEHYTRHTRPRGRPTHTIGERLRCL